jgi:hypothetical protein
MSRICSRPSVTRSYTSDGKYGNEYGNDDRDSPVDVTSHFNSSHVKMGLQRWLSALKLLALRKLRTHVM